MRRILVFLSVTLGGCSQPPPGLAWDRPAQGGVVAGTVELVAVAVGETPPANVVFYADGQPVGKAYGADGRYAALWNSRGAPAGAVVLSAKPFGGPAVTRAVTVTVGGE